MCGEILAVKEIIEKRRAYRALEPCEITEELIHDLALSAQLAASCMNNQPWNFIFVYDPEPLNTFFDVLSPGNAWGKKASMIVAVFSRADLDCQSKGRDYYLFDSGMATAHLILRATELGMVAHPILGFSETKTKKILQIPEDMKVVTLVIIGKHSTNRSLLNEQQNKTEDSRPSRKPLEDFIHLNTYKND